MTHEQYSYGEKVISGPGPKALAWRGLYAGENSVG